MDVSSAEPAPNPATSTAPAATPTSELRPPWWTLPALAVIAEAIFAGALVASCFLEDTTLRTTMFTGALTQATLAAQFYFGSSVGSQRKDETIAASNAALATSVPATAS